MKRGETSIPPSRWRALTLNARRLRLDHPHLVTLKSSFQCGVYHDFPPLYALLCQVTHTTGYHPRCGRFPTHTVVRALSSTISRLVQFHPFEFSTFWGGVEYLKELLPPRDQPDCSSHVMYLVFRNVNIRQHRPSVADNDHQPAGKHLQNITTFTIWKAYLPPTSLPRTAYEQQLSPRSLYTRPGPSLAQHQPARVSLSWSILTPGHPSLSQDPVSLHGYSS